MRSKIKIVSYCVGENAPKKIAGFKEFHAHNFDEIKIIETSSAGFPLNSCKIKAVEYVLSEILEGSFSTYILCDIDTRILRLRNLKSGIQGSDAGFYLRHSSPMHLSNLSGFIILNVTPDNKEFFDRFLCNWLRQYYENPVDWYSDQRSLIMAIYMSEMNRDIKYIDLSKIKNKLHFNWGTIPTIFNDAVTHKGNDKYLIFNTDYKMRWLAMIFDQVMILINLTIKFLRYVIRFNRF